MSSYRNQITPENYETWFIDYLDGHMQPDQKQQLFLFLEQHPHLKHELESIRETAIPVPAEFNYPHKNRLMKSSAAGTDLPETDYLLVKEIEEGLTPAEAGRLNSLTERFPEIGEDARRYKKTILIAPHVVYGKKKSLLRKRAGWIWPLAQGSIAAAVVITFMISRHDFFTPEKPVPLSPNLSQTKPVELHRSLVEVPVTNKTAPTVQDGSTLVSNALNTAATAPLLLPREEPVAFITLSGLNTQLTTSPIDAYEMGLAMMIPDLMENQKIQVAQDFALVDQPAPAEPSRSGDTNLVSWLVQKRLPFRKIYDTEGKLVAINLKSGDFEISQRLPKWYTR
jgi:hypothetical protein